MSQRAPASIPWVRIVLIIAALLLLAVLVYVLIGGRVGGAGSNLVPAVPTSPSP